MYSQSFLLCDLSDIEGPPNFHVWPFALSWSSFSMLRVRFHSHFEFQDALSSLTLLALASLIITLLFSLTFLQSPVSHFIITQLALAATDLLSSVTEECSPFSRKQVWEPDISVLISSLPLSKSVTFRNLFSLLQCWCKD